ncbi:MAG: ArsR/SmtB family transcription factor [Candidatus Nitrosotenuis sp.]
MDYAEDPVGVNDKIEILSTDDQRIKVVGELLSSDSSRMILKLLFNDQMTANQIAQKTEISLPLVIYHLKKMQEAGIVKVAQTAKNTKSHDMKYYTVDKFAIVILPSSLTEKAKSSKSLFNSFNRIYRFATIGGAAIAAWFSSQFIQQNQQITTSNERVGQADIMMGTEEAAQKSLQAPAPPATEMTPYAMQSDVAQTGEPLTDIYISIIVTLVVVVIGLMVERILRARRKE